MTLADNLPVIIGLIVVGLLVWLFLNARKKPPRSVVIPQFLFTVADGVYSLEAEAVAGLMTTEHHGGQFEDPDAVAIYRTGRSWFTPKPGVDRQNFRRRRSCYVTRQQDSSVLNLKGLFDPEVKLRRSHTKDDLKPRKSLAKSLAIVAGTKQSGNADTMMSRLSIMAGLAVVGGIAPWVAIAIAAVAK